MTNKQVAKTVLFVLLFSFASGFIVGALNIQAETRLLMVFLGFANIGTQFWAIGRLWSAKD